ncbi:hypothetical protein chiPu_0031859 [Chiloscyllium punctatum]|uniref:Uncharacterized protein n=1 Tax=Chiloscyllium punctatum TaxID=137246 RepID=A0A401TZD7_CHIPU|nr:hypothetical protein [Chiloscyllium punctatum]
MFPTFPVAVPGEAALRLGLGPALGSKGTAGIGAGGQQGGHSSRVSRECAAPGEEWGPEAGAVGAVQERQAPSLRRGVRTNRGRPQTDPTRPTHCPVRALGTSPGTL